jgi:PPOX class probable F420-dependent enzyme
MTEKAKAEGIPTAYQDLFQKRAFAHFATLMPDGSPQVTPVWIDFDGEYVLVNTAQGRQKDRNVERDQRVALSIQDPENPYRYIQVRGPVVEITTDGADAHIDALSQRYLGKDYGSRRPGEVRVIYKILPAEVDAH